MIYKMMIYLFYIRNYVTNLFLLIKKEAPQHMNNTNKLF